VCGTWSASLTTGMIPGSAFVPMPVIAGHARHELLRVSVLDFAQEPGHGCAPKDRRLPVMVVDHDLFADAYVAETT